MEDWRRILILKTSTVLDAIRIMDNSRLRIGFGMVVDDTNRLIGVLTDGDIRRSLLRGVELNSLVTSILSTSSPIIAYESEDKKEILDRFEVYKVSYIPVVTNDGVVVGLEINDVCFGAGSKKIPVIIMVGGRGSRLIPLTNECPKPMLKLGERPLLDLIVRNLMSAGFREFWLAINYKGEVIKDYFGDGSRMGASINYLKEEVALGTAGALALYAKEVNLTDAPVLVMNGDILTDINYDSLLQFYEVGVTDAVVCVKEYSYELPYGAVKIKENMIVRITEKPKYAFHVNSGIYVFNSILLSLIPENKFYDMTSFINYLIDQNYNIGAFLIREYWLDIGTKDGYTEAIRRVDYI